MRVAVYCSVLQCVAVWWIYTENPCEQCDVTHGSVASHLTIVTYEWFINIWMWVMSHKNESYHTWMSHLTYACHTWSVASHLTGSCHTWQRYIIPERRFEKRLDKYATMELHCWPCHLHLLRRPPLKCLCEVSCIYVYICVCMCVCMRVWNMRLFSSLADPATCTYYVVLPLNALVRYVASTYIYACVCVCVCVCMYVCMRVWNIQLFSSISDPATCTYYVVLPLKAFVRWVASTYTYVCVCVCVCNMRLCSSLAFTTSSSPEILLSDTLTIRCICIYMRVYACV